MYINSLRSNSSHRRPSYRCTVYSIHIFLWMSGWKKIISLMFSWPLELQTSSQGSGWLLNCILLQHVFPQLMAADEILTGFITKQSLTLCPLISKVRWTRDKFQQHSAYHVESRYATQRKLFYAFRNHHLNDKWYQQSTHKRTIWSLPITLEKYSSHHHTRHHPL